MENVNTNFFKNIHTNYEKKYIYGCLKNKIGTCAE